MSDSQAWFVMARFPEHVYGVCIGWGPRRPIWGPDTASNAKKLLKLLRDKYVDADFSIEEADPYQSLRLSEDLDELKQHPVLKWPDTQEDRRRTYQSCCERWHPVLPNLPDTDPDAERVAAQKRHHEQQQREEAARHADERRRESLYSWYVVARYFSDVFGDHPAVAVWKAASRAHAEAIAAGLTEARGTSVEMIQEIGEGAWWEPALPENDAEATRYQLEVKLAETAEEGSAQRSEFEACRRLAERLATDPPRRGTTSALPTLNSTDQKIAQVIIDRPGCGHTEIAQAVDRSYDHVRRVISTKLLPRGFRNERNGEGYFAPEGVGSVSEIM